MMTCHCTNDDMETNVVVQMLMWWLTGQADMDWANDEVTHGPMRRCHMEPSGRSKWFSGSAKSSGYHQIWQESSKSGEILLCLANCC
jgi:hypothetical protein